ncbi:MAG: enoyl-CoA hydratase/isomerase family protein [Actinomycetota bacterium]
MSFITQTTEDHIALVKLNRPEAMNSISGAMADELAEVFRSLAHDSDVWAVVLAAAGEKAFCAGADLKERAGFSLEDFYANRAQIRGLFEALRQVPQPVVAAVFGFALGGGFELALSCDLIVADRDTKLGLPEARVGLLPAGGGTQLLTRKLGTSRAKDLIFRGKRIDATHAQEMGLVTEVSEFGGATEAALEIARDICRSSPVAVRAAKRSIDAALGLPIDEGIEVENDAWKKVIASEDRTEGVAAFNEKRSPRWNNR